MHPQMRVLPFFSFEITPLLGIDVSASPERVKSQVIRNDSSCPEPSLLYTQWRRSQTLIWKAEGVRELNWRVGLDGQVMQKSCPRSHG